jgi:DNA-binding NarL/FixJ family response regulator
MTRELYTEVLNRHSGLHVVACAATVDEALHAAQTEGIDLALISTSLQDGPQSGLLALQQISNSDHQVKSVVLYEPSEAHLVVPAFRAGARGVFCPAVDGIRKLCRCVKRVHEGQIWANSAQLAQVLEAFSRSASFRIVDAKGARLLTKREESIVRLVEDGLTNRQIARDLRLSEHTVRNNLFRIFDKVGVSTRVELALYAINASKQVQSSD